jgi:hypothetical protein
MKVVGARLSGVATVEVVEGSRGDGKLEQRGVYGVEGNRACQQSVPLVGDVLK